MTVANTRTRRPKLTRNLATVIIQSGRLTRCRLTNLPKREASQAISLPDTTLSRAREIDGIDVSRATRGAG